MGKISDTLITKSGASTESYYDYLVSRFVAPYFTLFFKKIGMHNPNRVTLISFLFILSASAMVLLQPLLESLLYRIVIAVVIQLSFIFDCSDGQLARITGRSSRLGAWLDRILDRVGEFLIFSCFGYMAWQRYGSILYFFLGVITGYSLTLFTMAMTISDSVYLDNRERISVAKNEKEKEAKKEIAGRNSEKKKRKRKLLSILSKLFFYLNFGIGERYLYLSFFILIRRVDIMLFISSSLTVLRFLSISHHVGRRLRKNDRLLRSCYEHDR